MIGQPILRIIPPELHDEEVEILARLRRGKRIEHFDTVRLAKDGRRVDISLAVSPIRDSTGRVTGASKVARDVTERKEAEKLQRLLVDQLNHRVKNTLATVQAIASHSLRRARNSEDFVSSFTGRVQALARASSSHSSQRRAILRSVKPNADRSTGTSYRAPPEVGMVIPQNEPLRPLPPELGDRIAEVKDLQYKITGDAVLLHPYSAHAGGLVAVTILQSVLIKDGQVIQIMVPGARHLLSPRQTFACV